MQPYFFPYIGYFQLINAVDKFVFYDDVNYINRGWVNRNRILINNKANYITVQLIEASQNKPINEIKISNNRQKIKKTIEMAYKKAPFFDQAFPVIEACLDYETNKISELAIKTVMEVSNYLGINTSFEVSSQQYADTKGLQRAARLMAICKNADAQTYVNAAGGRDLYSKEDFENEGLSMFFIKPEIPVYIQYDGKTFVPELSIIDVMMFNPVKKIAEMLNDYELE